MKKIKKYCIHHIRGHYGTIVFAADLKSALRFIYNTSLALFYKNDEKIFNEWINNRRDI